MTTLSDDFNRANSTNIGAGWTETLGDYRIDANALQPVPGAGQSIVITATQLDTVDHYIEATYVDPSGTASKGIIARADAGPNNYYLLRNNGNDWSLFSAVSGTFTGIGQYVAPAQAGDVARLECIGDQIKAYINGIERIAVTNTAVTVGQHVGFRDSDSGTHYDNFTAVDVSAEPTGRPGARVHDGVSWVDSPANRIHNGTSWVQSPSPVHL